MVFNHLDECRIGYLGHTLGCFSTVLIASFLGSISTSGHSLVYLDSTSELNHILSPSLTGPNQTYPGLRLNGNYGMGVFYDSNGAYWRDTSHPASMLGCGDLERHGVGTAALTILALTALVTAAIGHYLAVLGHLKPAMYMSGIGHLTIAGSMIAMLGLTAQIFVKDWDCEIPEPTLIWLATSGLTRVIQDGVSLSSYGSKITMAFDTNKHFSLGFGVTLLVIGILASSITGVLIFCCGFNKKPQDGDFDNWSEEMDEVEEEEQ